MTFGPQSSAEEQAVIEMMARRQRNICEGHLRSLLDTNLDVENRDYERYFMAWVANRGLTAVADGETMLRCSRDTALPDACPPPGTGAGVGDDTREPVVAEGVTPVVVPRSYSTSRTLARPMTLARDWLRLLAMSRPLSEFHTHLTGKVNRRAIHAPVLPGHGARHHLKSKKLGFVMHERWWRLSGRSEIARLTNSPAGMTSETVARVEDEPPPIPVQRRAKDRLLDIDWPMPFRRMATVPA